MKKSSIKKLNYPYNSNSICGAQLCLIGISNNVTHSCLLLLDEVAVIDEIQMIRDQQRGWAWTRSLLGLCAHEIHICGEASAIDLVKELMLDTGDEVEVGIFLRFMVQRGWAWTRSLLGLCVHEIHTYMWGRT
jgi:hypothetical protein